MRYHIAIIALGLSAAACAPGTTPELPIPTEPRGVPGFDTRHYPGDAAMRVWLDDSPYQWVGFYLPAPCYTGTSWQGKRDRIERMGWGTAVLFVGEQDWGAMGRDPVMAPPEPAAEPRCTRSNLTAEKGERDAAEAAAAAAAEGFARGTAIYLDVERVESVSAELETYVRAWTRALVRDGRYRPALYAHAQNAERLLGIMAGASIGAGGPPAPRLWLAQSRGFELGRAPVESGFPAHVWQGLHDVDESWGGVTLRVDVNVAASRDPSG